LNQLKHQFNPELFLEKGSEVLNFINKRFNLLESSSIKPDLKPGDLATRFSSTAPQTAQGFDNLINDLETKIMPGVTHWQHPRFFSYYPGTSSLPAVISELLIASIGAIGLQWGANPIGTELECVVMDWIVKMLQATDDSPFLHTSGLGGGLIQNTAGESLVVIMTAARINKHLQLTGAESIDSLTALEQDTLFYQDSSKFVVYMSDQSHFSGSKAARVAGIRVHTVKAKILDDGNYGIDCEQVRLAMDEDRDNGLIPCAVQLNYGSTNTCGYDDIDSFQGFAEQENVWLHVDAAYAGASLVLPQFREKSLVMQSIATSFNFNGSKWFLCGFDSAFLYVRDRKLLTAVFAASGDYMDSIESEEVYSPEFKDWSVPLGRRFRALRIWMVLEYFGVEGVQEFLQLAIDQGDWLRHRIDESDDFTLTVENDLGLVCFSPKDSNKTGDLIAYLQNDNNDNPGFLLYPSQINGEAFIRVALGGVNTSFNDVESFWKTCEQWAK